MQSERPKWFLIKSLMLFAGMLFATETVFGQGTIIFSDYSAGRLVIQIYAGEHNVTVEVVGNTSTDIPSGATTYNGTLIGGSSTGTGPFQYANGADYSVELYAAPGDNAASSSLTPVTQYYSTFYTTATAAAGFFKPISPINDPGIPNTPSATVGSATGQLAVWYNGGGIYTTYGLAVGSGVPLGKSPAFNIDDLGGYNDNGKQPPDLPPLMTNLQSFTLFAPQAIPEPGSVILGLIGAATFMLRRRKLIADGAHGATHSWESFLN